jgi:hypothetical protein
MPSRKRQSNYVTVTPVSRPWSIARAFFHAGVIQTRWLTVSIHAPAQGATGSDSLHFTLLFLTLPMLSENVVTSGVFLFKT